MARNACETAPMEVVRLRNCSYNKLKYVERNGGTADEKTLQLRFISCA